jgi:PAS domain S-box-containing protein
VGSAPHVADEQRRLLDDLERERAALARSEDQFRAAFDGSPLALLIADPDGVCRRANPAAEALLGRSLADLVGLSYRAITTADDLAATTAISEQIQRGTRDRATQDKQLVRGDGSRVWARLTITVIPGPDGQRWRLIQAQDITAERAAAQRSAHELARLRAVLAVQREVIAAASDRDATLTLVAARATELFDDADGAVVELVDAGELVHSAAAGSLAGSEGTRIALTGSLSGEVVATGIVARCWDTSTDPRVDRDTCLRLGIGSMLIAPLYAEGRVIGTLKVAAREKAAFDDSDEQHLALLAGSLSAGLRHASDAARNALLLAERTDALAALQASEQRFRLAFENSPLGLTLVSLNPASFGHYLQANPAMTTITGFSADELTSMTFRDLVHPDDALASAESLQRVVVGQADNEHYERRYLHKDGRPVWVSLRSAAVRDKHGQALYLVVQVEDITAQRAARAQLEQQARLLELIPAAVIVRELSGAITWWSPGAEELYGWPAGAALGKSTHRLLATRFASAMTTEELDALLADQGRWEGELRHLRSDGRFVTVLSRQVAHAGDGAGTSVLEVNADITAVRAAERALAESEQRFRAQFAHSAVGQVVRALDGTYLDVNAAYARMLGRSVDELIGTNDVRLIHPDDYPGTQREVADLFAGEKEYTVSEGRVRHADGHWVDVQASVSVVWDSGGQPKHLIGVVSDISARKAAERARDEAAAALAERNAELERANQLKLDLIGMLGHDIGNPLTSILGSTEAALSSWDTFDATRRIRTLEVIERQANRINDITREVLAMVSIDAGTMQARRRPVEALAEVARALMAVGAEDVPVRGEPVTVLANPDHLQQILVNLLSNAAKYGGGATSLEVGSAAGRARIQIVDSGPGVPEEFRPHLFDRLTRADRDAHAVTGTGLGLYIVRGLAQANQGDVWHEPNPAGGSVFVVDLEAIAPGGPGG